MTLSTGALMWMYRVVNGGDAPSDADVISTGKSYGVKGE